MGVNDCKLIALPKILDHRGNLTFLEGESHIPFSIKRVFYIYNVPCGIDRGGHAHFALQQFVICLAGGLNIHLDDGQEKRTVFLNQPWMGLYVPPMIWASEGDFSPGTLYLVLASDTYRPESYIRDYRQFLNEVENHG